ncbi:MAG TPA: hypothetical protein VFA49_09140 [Chloroflexota bacterium]|nr:hypothetical protein [Chloroflexota bacterium]
MSGAKRENDATTGGPQRNYQAEADAELSRLVEGLSPEEAALALAVLASRLATRLHNLSRAEAGARKGQPDWGGWAQLQNASRSSVLQASTCRDLAARLAGRRG